MASLNLSGALHEVPLPDIVRLLHAARRTGQLAMAADDSTGSLYFERGEIVDCHSNQLSGLDAVRHLALFSRGSFEFVDEVAPPDHALSGYPTTELIRVLETRMLEARQIQELMPAEYDIPHYPGGTMPPEFEVSAAELAVAMRASSGKASVAQIAQDLGLDLMTVRYTIARFHAVGMMEMQEGIAPPEAPEPVKAPTVPISRTTQSLPSPDATSGDGSSAKPRYWRGRRVD